MLKQCRVFLVSIYNKHHIHLQRFSLRHNCRHTYEMTYSLSKNIFYFPLTFNQGQMTLHQILDINTQESVKIYLASYGLYSVSLI